LCEGVEDADAVLGRGGQAGADAQKFWAPVMDRIQPETLIRSFPILISRSAALLSNGLPPVTR
jgi:hypothetical protein